MSDTEVRVGCLCPDPATHPDGDTVTFVEKLDFRQMATARWTVEWAKSEGVDSIPEILAMLTEFYLLNFIESWTLTDGKKALPVTKPNIRERVLSNADAAFELAEVADSLYSSAVIVPLVRRASRLSPTSLTNGSTSATNGNGKSHKRSKRSLTSTTPTVATALTPK